MTIALDIPPNWYPDPSGRAQARYWDGRMWTAHVVRDGMTTLDPIDGVQQPRQEPVLTHGVTPAEPAPTVGHGTLSLQKMAAARPAPPPPRPVTPARASEPRLSTLATLGLLLGALALVGFAVFLYQQGAFAPKSSRRDLTPTVKLEQVEYSLDVPKAWVARDPGTPDVDAGYLVPDVESVAVVIADDAVDGLALRSTRDDALAFTAGIVAGAVSPTAKLVDGKPREVGKHRGFVAEFIFDASDGVPGRILEYLVEHDGRIVAILAVGTPDGIDRHRSEIRRAAVSTSFK